MTFTDDTDGLYVFYLETQDNTLEIKKKLLDLKGKRVILDSANIICEDQVKVALFRANRAQRNNTMIANNWNVEVLLRIGGTHQIKEAFQLLDVKEFSKIILIIQENDVIPLNNAIPGFPKFRLNNDVLIKYKIKDTKNPCLEIITRGAKVIVDYS